MIKKNSPDFARFEEISGITFKNKDLLRLAFTHRSYLNENRGTETSHNERLEFLGDAVLELMVTEHLFEKYPDSNEGDLTAYRASLVNAITLSEAAQKIQVNDFLLLSKGETKDTGKARQYILANTMEAIIGAIYLDSGLRACHDVIQGLWGEKIHVLKEPPIDAKTGLQEWAQARKKPVPKYEIVKREGPDHAPFFHISVTVEGYDPQIGAGSSRRIAEKDAAKKLLNYLEENHWHE